MIDPPTFILASVGGGIAGSFVGTAVVRMPQGRSALVGRSQCDGCGQRLRFREMVPVLSYLAARGHCRRCRGTIGVDHPIAEVGCIVGCLAAAAAASDITGMLCLSIFACTLVALAILDARHFWLPDRFTLPLIVAGLSVSILLFEPDLTDRVIGALVGYFGLEIIRVGYGFLRGREGLGRGDAKLMAAIGAWMGWGALPYVLLMAASAGIAIVIACRAAGHPVGGSSRIPLGTLLAVAAIALLPFW